MLGDLEKSMKLRERIVERLKSHPGEQFKARELAEWLLATYPEDAAAKMQSSVFLENETQLRNQLVAEIGANRPAWQKKHPQLKTTADKPRRFYWASVPDELVTDEPEGPGISPPITEALSEAELYPKLIEYLRFEQGVFAMRIDEKKSSNKKGAGGNKWLYPDICGLKSEVSDMRASVVSLVNLTASKKSTLWSFEVKKTLSNSNVREAYFQSVSNSSWANSAYLVAETIDEAVEGELEMLHRLHGVGVLRLNAEEPSESQILFHSRFRETVDWASFDRLATENADFREYAERLEQFLQTNKLKEQIWF